MFTAQHGRRRGLPVLPCSLHLSCPNTSYIRVFRETEKGLAISWNIRAPSCHTTSRHDAKNSRQRTAKCISRHVQPRGRERRGYPRSRHFRFVVNQDWDVARYSNRQHFSKFYLLRELVKKNYPTHVGRIE